MERVRRITSGHRRATATLLSSSDKEPTGSPCRLTPKLQRQDPLAVYGHSPKSLDRTRRHPRASVAMERPERSGQNDALVPTENPFPTI